MKTRIPPHTTALALVLLALISLSWDNSATARPPGSVTSFIATESDFPIWEWHFSNACDEMHADVAYNEDDDEYLVVFDWDLNGSDDHDIMAVTVSADGQAAMSPFSIAYDAAYDDAYPASLATLTATATWWSGNGEQALGTIASTAALSPTLSDHHSR